MFTQDAASSKIVAQACRQHACPSEVHRVVEVLKGLEDRGDNVWKRTYTIAMVHCLRHKKPMKALDLMNDLRDKGCQLTPNLYAILVNIYAEQRLPDKIRQTIREMRSYNMPVTVQTYNGLFKAMIRAKDPQINEIRKAFLYKRVWKMSELCEMGLFQSLCVAFTSIHSLNTDRLQAQPSHPVLHSPVVR